MYLSDAHIRYLFPSKVPVKMDFSSVPEFLLVFNYPVLRDIKDNDISIGSLECCHFWFRVKILPLTTIFSMLEASFVWQRVFPYGTLKLCICVWREYPFLFMLIFHYEWRIIFMFCKNSIFFTVLKTFHYTSASFFPFQGQLLQKSYRRWNNF